MIKSVILFLVTKEMSKKQQMHAKAGQERTEIMGQKQQALEIIQAERSGLEALSDAIWDHPEVDTRRHLRRRHSADFWKKRAFWWSGSWQELRLPFLENSALVHR